MHAALQLGDRKIAGHVRIVLLPPAKKVWGKVIFQKRLSFCSRWGKGLPTGGDLPTGGLHPAGIGQTPPPKSEKWAVRIVLKCFLVPILFCSL